MERIKRSESLTSSGKSLTSSGKSLTSSGKSLTSSGKSSTSSRKSRDISPNNPPPQELYVRGRINLMREREKILRENKMILSR